MFARRDFLALGGASTLFPFLYSEDKNLQKSVKRLVCVTTPYGMIPQYWFPKGSGETYQPSRELQILDQHRGHYTAFSHLDHGKHGKGGHSGVHAYLSGIRINDSKGFAEKNISIDMKAAQQIGSETRFPYLNYAVAGGLGAAKCSYSHTGVWIQPEVNLPLAYRKLFSNLPLAQRQNKQKDLDLDLKIIHALYQMAKPKQASLGQRDQQKLEEYFDSTHELGKRIQNQSKWVMANKPQTDMHAPDTGDLREELPLFYELAFQALKTDTTRVITMEMPGSFATAPLEVDRSYHGASHHGKAIGALEMMFKIESYFLKNLSFFIDQLKNTPDPIQSGTMLDNTIVVFGSGMGNSSSHSNDNMPTLVAGGGFKHVDHHISSQEDRVPLCNLWLTVLQQLGCSIDQFNRSTASLQNFEVTA